MRKHQKFRLPNPFFFFLLEVELPVFDYALRGYLLYVSQVLTVT